ncbi:hypothetical protein CDO73_15515 [Saccharibacillus sp. O23]|uniref:MFS transporter n=1 Tax=Saccharibacillus sp. O23 TaxID=2009338 RepID=UPI000B4DF15A|nr:MFS transporter [Saccharibacillus sp. O23]OWR29590.1 hypothetical protein CDO73_15515 [Saccharibacillus sp. O23]
MKNPFGSAYSRLISAVALSSFGDAFGLLAMEWLVYGLTGSKLAMGTLALCAGIPELMLRLLGGPLVDRFPKGRLMAVLAVIRLAAVSLPLILGAAGRLELWHLFAAAAATGACSALFMPAALASIPALTGKKGGVRAFAVMDGVRSGAALIGPAAAGGMTALWGALAALGVDAACYAAGALLLLSLPASVMSASAYSASRPADHEPPSGKSGGRLPIRILLTNYVGEIREGFGFYRHYPAMLLVMLLVSISNMGSGAVWTMMVPYGREILRQDAAAIGLLATVSSLGTAAGIALIAWIGEVRRYKRWMLGSLSLIGLLYMAMGLTSDYGLALALVFLIGLSSPFFSSLSSSLYGRLVPDGMQGRVNTIRYFIGGSLQPAGGFLGGAIGHAWGLPALFLIAGGLPLLCSLGALPSRLLNRLDAEPADPSNPSASAGRA